MSAASPARAALAGHHLTADLSGCEAAHPWMQNAEALRETCLAHVTAVGLTAVADRFHAFPPRQPGEPAGVTGVVLLAESHLALHTWPELAAVTLDVYVCNRSGDHSRQARQVLATLRAMLSPARVEEREIMRGALGRPPAVPPASPA